MKSMTGYGRARQVLHGRTVTVELRAVNHRYLDCTVKAPRQFGFLDDAVKKAAAARIAEKVCGKRFSISLGLIE